MRPASVSIDEVGTTDWIVLDRQQAAFNVGYGVRISGDPTYDVEVTYEDIFATQSPTAHKLTEDNTTNTHGKVDRPVTAIRLNVTAIATAGSAALDVLQAIH